MKNENARPAPRGWISRLLAFCGMGILYFLWRLLGQEKKDDDGLKKTVLTWGIILGLAVSFILWGVFAFYVIGDRWPPGWSYGVIPDVPGKSLYSIRRPKEHRAFEVRPHQSAGPVERQHVRGRPAESTPYLPREEP